MKDNKNVKIKVKIELLSPVQLASGKANVVIDSDAVHDEYGVPYFPAKRFKGLLYESAVEIMEMGELCGKTIICKNTINDLFGKNENSKEEMFIHDFVLPRYDEMRKAWEYLNRQFPGIIDKDAVLKEYTSVRYQTEIDNETGIAKKGSLRNMRVVDHVMIEPNFFPKVKDKKNTKKGNIPDEPKKLCFEGFIDGFKWNEDHIKAIAVAISNIRYAGAKRNRGFGHIKCSICSIKYGDKECLPNYSLDKILK